MSEQDTRLNWPNLMSRAYIKDESPASSGEAERLATALEQKAEEAPGATRRGVMREAAALRGAEE